ncbi:NAD(P)-dependent alcohol dehydrogenase [Planctomycetota bacterium]
MKAIVYTKYGSPDVLGLKEVEKPTPRDNEVLIKVHAASINSWDYDLLRGTFQGRIGAFRKPRWEILGCDIAGIVEAVGKDVKNFKKGDRVFGDISQCGGGGFAEYICARENALTLKPAKMTFEQAAAIPQGGLLALQGLRKGKIQKGQKVLINGAGGAGGTFAIQLAKHLGAAEITGVDSTEKLDTLKSLGCDYVIDYTKEDFTKNGKHYDLILDVKSTRSVFDYKRALSANGIYVTVGGNTFSVFQVMLLGPLISGSKKVCILIHRPNKGLDVMKELFEKGKVKPVIDKIFPLSKVPEAFRYFGEGHFKGKIVISVGHT